METSKHKHPAGYTKEEILSEIKRQDITQDDFESEFDIGLYTLDKDMNVIYYEWDVESAINKCKKWG